jgi:hypothetical protein
VPAIVCSCFRVRTGIQKDEREKKLSGDGRKKMKMKKKKMIMMMRRTG